MSEHKNILKKIRCVKSEYLDESLLKEYYEYIKENGIEEVEDVSEADLIISFGGDGTTLVAAKEALKKNVPVMAVNMGSLGYLAEISPENLVEMLKRYQNGKYVVDERAFLEVKYNKKTYYALKEFVLLKSGMMSHLIQVEVYENNTFVNEYRADGVIVATPTGSTAYSLSAGGSIVYPGLKAVTITPLSPQGLTARPIIIDGGNTLSFKVFSRDNDAHLNLDGSICIKVKQDDTINARLSNKKVKIIKSGKNDYYSILRQKLKWGDAIIK